MPAANTGLAKVAVQCSADTFVVNQSLVRRINICGENRPFAKPETVVGNALKKMRLLIDLLIILTLTTSTLFGQDIKKCDITILKSSADKIGQLNQKEITDFLLTFGFECENNVEYSEWSNELLFQILYEQTELTCKIIEKKEKKFDKKAILNDLSDPITDRINILKLITKIEKVNFNERIKSEIIQNLKAADGKKY